MLATVLLVTRLSSGDAKWYATSVEVASSALNVQNWWLAQRSVDYLAADGAPSPVQHFWSLSVEEQFYLLWPVLLLVCATLAMRSGLNLRRVVLATIALVIAVSFAHSVLLSHTAAAGTAFFVTTGRVWELAAGAVLAAWMAPAPTLGKRSVFGKPIHRLFAAAVGLVMIVSGGVWFSHETRWPGAWALVPVLGTAVVIWAAIPPGSGLGRLLALRPLQTLGNLSYSLYLWHWPLIVLLPDLSGRPVSAADRFFVLALTIALAVLTRRYVEERYRARRRPGRTWPCFLAAGLATTVVLAGSTAMAITVMERQKMAKELLAAVVAGPAECLGAAALVAQVRCRTPTDTTIVPDPIVASTDQPKEWSDGCMVPAPWRFTGRCTFGPAEATMRIALVGNSHAVQWAPAMRVLAERHRWRVTVFAATSCQATAADPALKSPRLRSACLDWGRKVMAATSSDQFDLVITSELTESTVLSDPDPDPSARARWRAGYQQYLQAWSDARVPVLVLRDTPFPRATVEDVPRCLSENRGKPDACSGAREEWLRADPLFDVAASSALPGISAVDLTDLFCGEVCPAVVGNVSVYMDGHHIGATYARTLASFLGPKVQALLPSVGGAGKAS